MKKIVLLFLIGILHPSVWSQNFQTVEEVRDLCSEYLGFSTNQDAENTVDRIMSQIGLARHFTLQECPKIQNARAFNLKEDNGSYTRYILYDREFLKSVGQGTDYAAIFILAHEIGHHLNGHALIGKGSTPPFELEADYFAGRIMAQLGYSLDQTLMALRSLQSESGSATHAPKAERIQEATLGYKSYNQKTVDDLEEITDPRAQIALEDAQKDFQQQDFKGALENIKKFEERINNWYPMVSFIKIASWDGLKQYHNSLLKVEVEKFLSYFENNYSRIELREFKQVLEIQERLQRIEDASIFGTHYYNEGLTKYRAGAYGEAKSLFIKATEQENGKAMNYLGYMYYAGKGFLIDYSKALSWYLMSAETGYEEAQTSVGAMFQYGFGVDKNMDIAINWYKKAIQNGSASGMYNLALIYISEDKNYQDYPKANALFELSSELGNRDAMNQLGISYHLGRGLPLAYEKAFYWYKKAADLNQESAIFNIGLLYYNGYGVAKDVDIAIAYYQKAARLGSQAAKNELTRLGKTW